MREVGAIPDCEAAERLANYLLTVGIATRLNQEPSGWVLWVRDEDQLERARQELEQFLRDPKEARYQNVNQAAAAVREREAERDKEYRKNYVDVRDRWDRQAIRTRPLTLGIIGICAVVGILTRLGSGNEELIKLLSISTLYWRGPLGEQLPNWSQVLGGEVWRLVTPIFLHFGFPHIVFNMWCWYVLASVVEIRRGTWRLALFVLVCAVLSNIAQYQLSWYPYFGGMSGVVYGLFGYIWMKSRFDTSAGMYMDPRNTFIMIAWLFLCMTGVMGNIANTAHVVGLLVGIVVGYAPILWRHLR
jgi:GlpG protein